MRVSTGYTYEVYLGEIDRTSSAYFDAQQAVSTGKRIRQASDDPNGTTNSLSMRSLLTTVNQFSSNLENGKNFLNFTDAALSNVSNALNSAYQVALSGANGTNDQATRNGMVDQITPIEQSLVQLANSKGANGQYIFAGQKTDTQPFVVQNGKLVYSGDQNSISVETGPSDTLAVNTQGSPLFTDAYAMLEDLKKNLLSGSTGAISSTNVGALKDAITNVNGIRGQIGSKVQLVNQLQGQNTQRVQDLTTGISNVEDVDVSQAVINLKQTETAYQAALAATGGANKFSLLDFINI